MRIKFLVPLLLAGASSVAVARPHARHEFRPAYSQVQTSQRPYGYQVDSTFSGVSVRTYAYGANPRQADIARADWMLFADGVSLRNGAASVALGGRRLDAIQLQATHGDSFVEAVLVDLDDGRRLTITPARQLDVQHAPNLRIDLGRGIHCGVRAVTVVGRENGWSSFRVIAG